VISTIIQAIVAYLFLSDSTSIPTIDFFFLPDETNQNIKYWGELLTFNYPVLLGIISTLIWTVLIYLLFRKSKYNFTELLVSSLYFYGTIFILINLISIVYKPLTNDNLPMNFVSVIGFVYMTFAYFNFFKGVSAVWRLLKIFIVFFGMFVFRMLILPLILDSLFPIN
jgi:predicted neutral ceramidase superfamily lipid hydrolase